MRRPFFGYSTYCLRSQVALLVMPLVCLLLAQPLPALEFPGPSPGTATAMVANERVTIENLAVRGVWDLRRGGPVLEEVTDRLTGRTLRPKSSESFVIELADGSKLAASQLQAKGGPSLERLLANPQAVRSSERFAGWRASGLLVSTDPPLEVRWEILLRDQSNYLRHSLTLEAKTGPVQVRKVTMIDTEVPTAEVQGKVVGSPVATDNLFLACEHPMADNRAEGGRVVCAVPRYRPLVPGRAWTVSSVVGVVPQGQLRRGFLYYLERERARPYSPLFYYISWFDIAYSDRKMNEQLCLKVIEDFGREMATKRGVKPDAFVFDDGWDDNRTLWLFHEAFPKGFSPLQKAAARYGAFLGTWLSPWGGYSKAKAARLQYGKEQGFEIAHGGFSLAGPTYFARFRDVCAEHARKYGVRYFKFDGIGKGSGASGPGEEFGADLEAMLDLIADLRALYPDMFFNTTVGTWPSPFWLFYSDATWRHGRDIGHHGAGSSRQQWLTYRDMMAYRARVLNAPLYPLNSLKFQGVMYAQLGLATNLNSDVDDLIDDIHVAAASGTQLQEFFVTSSMMSAKAWDAVAESIRWMRQNADVLVDSHWIVGDPGAAEIYGYASWAPRKGILVLRNPADKPASTTIDLQKAFELPKSTPTRYRLKAVWQKKSRAEKVVDLAQPQQFELEPLELMVFEALPASS